MLSIRTIDKEKDVEKVEDLFVTVFSQEPWNDHWDDRRQLRLYIEDLLLPFNALSFGLYQDEELVGICLGRMMHFFEGNQLRIDELCVRTDCQGKGYGSRMVALIEEEARKRGIAFLILATERNYPAFRFYKKNGFVEAEGNVMLSKKVL